MRKLFTCTLFVLNVMFIQLTDALAQSNRAQFSHITTEDGLPQNMVDCMLQDRQGFFWFGTWNGLCRYDGYSFEVFNDKSADGLGLQDIFIYDLHEDQFGNIWVGTKNGLYVYLYELGKFSLITEKQGLLKSDTEYHAISQLDKNSIIVGSKKSVSVLHLNDKLANYTIKHHRKLGNGANEFAGTVVNSVLKDSKNDIWVGTDQGLFRMDSGFRLLNKYISDSALIGDISSNAIVDIFESQSGDIWIGTESGLNKYLKASDTFLSYYNNPSNPKSLPHNTIMNIKENRDGQLLLGTLGGFSVLDVEKNEFSNYSNIPNQKVSLNNDFVNCILLDVEGNIWIGTERGGVNIYNTNQNVFEHYEYEFNNPNSLSHNTVNSIYEDTHNIWIGTAGGGLNKYNKASRKFKHYEYEVNNSASISSNFVTAILRTSDGNLWTGTWGHGINVLINEGTEKEYFKKYNNSNSGLASNFVSAIIEGDDGNIWIGSLGGLVRYDAKNGTFNSVFSSESETKIRGVGCLIIDQTNHLWVGTQFGLFNLPIDDYLNTNPTAFRQHSDKAHSISGDYVISLKEDHQGNIWAGTYGHGINKITPKNGSFTIKSFNSTNGISNTIIYSIEEDFNHDLWLSTDYGLTRFDPEKESSRNFYKTNGLLNNQYYWSASYQNKEGKLYFGGMDGMDAFYPDWIKDDISEPEVIITDVKLVNESIVPGKEYNGEIAIVKNASLTSSITLSHKEKIFSIEFSALNFFNADVITYAYFLEGFDTKWNDVAPSRHFASYTNLVPGQYKFMVKAAGANGVFSKNPTVITINITPPFWQTWWFRIAFVLFLVSFIVGYVKYRTYSLKVQKVALERLVSQRTEEISMQKEALSYQAIQLQKSNKTLEHNQELIEGQNKKLEEQNREILSQRDEVIELNEKLNLVSQLKLSFFTNISHEFRTPLTLIIGPLERLLGIKSLKGEVRDTLEVMSRNAQRLLHLINEIMEFRKIEKGKIELKVAQGNLTSFCESIFNAFEPLAEIKQIKFSFNAGESLSKTWFDAEKIENILYNLLSNAFKYTPNKGTIRMKIGMLSKADSKLNNPESEDIISIKITDSGAGISKENLPLIFKRFYRIESENAFKIGGSGIGLAITEELIKSHHGEIFVSSEPGKGSVFEIQFPNLRGKQIAEESAVEEINIHSQIEILKNELLVHEDDLDTSKALVLKKDRDMVLVVEDNSDLRKFISLRLSEKYNIIEAADGENGIKFAEKYNPDLIVSDVMMPKVDGFELCATVKNNFSTSHIPVILLTAKSSVENQIEGLQIGADDYLPKPFNFELLEARVHNLIQSRRQFRLQFAQEDHLNIDQVTSNAKDAKFLEKAINIVEEHLSNSSFGSKDLLLFLGISRSLLHKKLTSLTNQSATEFINQIKMKKAKELLKKPELNISEVAYSVGYNDPKYFSRLFGKHFGHSPKEYQEKL